MRPSENKQCQPSRDRPVDLVHLARQTGGDRELEGEILAMFARQLAGTTERFRAADRSERLMIAHTIKGSARGVGAFALADCAVEIEARPDDLALQRELGDQIDAVCAFVEALGR